jgi:hypothetical protein
MKWVRLLADKILSFRRAKHKTPCVITCIHVITHKLASCQQTKGKQIMTNETKKHTDGITIG